MSSSQLHDPGFATASAQLSKEQSLAEARKILIDTIEGLVKEPPSKDEVERARTRLLRTMEMRMTDTQSVGLNLSEWAAMGDWRLMFLNRDRIRNVTPEDVARVAKTYFIESNRTVGEFIPTGRPERAKAPRALGVPPTERPDVTAPHVPNPARPVPLCFVRLPRGAARRPWRIWIIWSGHDGLRHFSHPT